MGVTLRSLPVTTRLQRIAEQAVRHPRMVFTALAHLMDVEFLREAYRRTKKTASPGVDEVTAGEYAEELEENLRGLHERLRTARYKPPPVERVWMREEGRKPRPIGKPTFEDKLVQRAVAMLLGAIYEQEFSVEGDVVSLCALRGSTPAEIVRFSPGQNVRFSPG